MNPLARFLLPGTVLHIFGAHSMALFELFSQFAREQGWTMEFWSEYPNLPPADGEHKLLVVPAVMADSELGSRWALLLPEAARAVKNREDVLLVGVSDTSAPAIWRFIPDARLLSSEEGTFTVAKHRGGASLQDYTFALDANGEWVNASK